jgi:GT2 family glycosyltransferase
MIGGWNYIVKKAKGEYIKFLASDDLLEPSCVEDLVGIASKYPQAALITCTRKFVDNTGHIIKKMGFASRTERVGGIEHARWILTSIRQNLIGEPTAVMYPKRLVRLAGEYDARFSQFADFEYWIRLLAYGDLVYLHKPLCSFRVHASSNTSKAILDGRFITEIFTLINKYYKDPIFLNTFSLSEVDRAKVIKLKTLDTLKNIKDLMLNGHFSQSARYIAQLTSSLYNTFHA